MASLERSIDIEAPVEAVFQFMDDPDNQPKISSDAARIEDVVTLAEGGTQSSYVYQVGPGIEVEGRLTTSEYVPNRRIVYDFSGGLQGNIQWQFEPIDDDQSRVTYTADYELDMPLLGDMVASLAAKFSQTEIETQLANLKRLMESP